MPDPMNIVLIGYRCSGKTSVGRVLARALGRRFVDTDDWIERTAGCSVEAIVLRDGWERFRKMEKEVVKKVSEGVPLVIATGGGVVMDDENVGYLKERGLMVWLRAEAKVLRERMGEDRRRGMGRPPIAGRDAWEEIEEVLKTRTPFYERASDMVVDSGAMVAREVAARIVEGLRTLKKRGG